MRTPFEMLRLKRYRAKNEFEIVCVIQSSTGVSSNLVLDNCSLFGLGLRTDKELKSEDGFIIGEIIVSSKLVYKDDELPLGRLVLRTVRQDGRVYFYGLSLIDSRVPIEKFLSRFIELDFDDQKTPFDFEMAPGKFSPAVFEQKYSHVDLFLRTRQYKAYCDEWEKDPKYGYYSVRTPSSGSRVKLKRTRKTDRNDYLVMGSNDYLGLASNPLVVEAAKKALDEYGFGSTGSPLSTGITEEHVKLVNRVSTLLEKESTILFNSGYTANVGVIAGLCMENDLILADFLSHASIRDGIAQTKATYRYFRHNDLSHLEKLLKSNRSDYAGALIITEGIFSMDGDCPDLRKLVSLARKYNARIMVDEAHSLGVVGKNGFGTCHDQNVVKEIDIIMGTFSKIGGGIGGFVSSRESVTKWLWWFARSHMFTVSLPPSTAAAMCKALEIFQGNPDIVHRLQDNIRHFARGVRNLGFGISENHKSSIFPLIIGDEKKLGIINDYLMDNGIFCVPMVYPIVSRNSCRFRFTMTAKMTISDLDLVLSVLESAMRLANFKPSDLAVQAEEAQG